MEEQEKPIKKKRGKHRNRVAGHNFEREIMHKLKEIGFPHVVTARSESRNRDNQGIDLINSNELKNGRLPYNLQCKSTTGKVDYHKLLERLSDVEENDAIDVVLHRFTVKKQLSGQFHSIGQFAIMSMESFLQMAEIIEHQRAALAQIKQEQNETTTGR